MMKRMGIWLITISVLAMGSVNQASALTLTIFESITNRDGSLTQDVDSLTVPQNWKATFSTPGAHFFGLFVDAEIDEPINTFFNEYGVAIGTPDGNLSWEIDEPGYGFGDIYDNFMAGFLDGTNGVPDSAPDDVSMALMWDFILLPGEVADLEFLLSTDAPTTGFYLTQVDPDSNAAMYFSTSLNIRAVPEPATLVLLLSGLMGGGLCLRKRRRA